MVSYMIIWQGKLRRAVARGLSCAEAVVHAHVNIAAAVGTPTIDRSSTCLGRSGEKSYPNGQMDSQGMSYNRTLLRFTLRWA